MESKTVVQEPKKVSKAPLGILVIFLGLLILGLAAIIFGSNTNWTFKGFDLKSVFFPKQTQLCDKGESTCDELSATNVGWGIFSLPEYGFSVEIPDYKLKQTLGIEEEEQEIYSYWSVKHSGELYEPSLHYDKNLYEDSVTVSFYPSYMPPSVACGQGCVNEHFISIDIYRNEGNKDLETVKKVIEENLQKAFSFEDNEDSKYDGQLLTKWDREVWSFAMEFIGGATDGYIVVTDDYVYYIDYYLADSPTASHDIALKVLDTLTFSD